LLPQKFGECFCPDYPGHGESKLGGALRNPICSGSVYHGIAFLQRLIRSRKTWIPRTAKKKFGNSYCG
jgi:hypothetical protein